VYSLKGVGSESQQYTKWPHSPRGCRALGPTVKLERAPRFGVNSGAFGHLALLGAAPLRPQLLSPHEWAQTSARASLYSTPVLFDETV
jgi:hypothetical protein